MKSTATHFNRSSFKILAFNNSLNNSIHLYHVRISLLSFQHVLHTVMEDPFVGGTEGGHLDFLQEPRKDKSMVSRFQTSFVSD